MLVWRRYFAWVVMLGAALGCAPIGRAQQTVAQYNCLGETVFCEQDLDALDGAVKLTPEQREAVGALMRAALSKQTALIGRLSRENIERWTKFNDAKRAPEEVEKPVSARSLPPYHSQPWSCSPSATAVRR